MRLGRQLSRHGRHGDRVPGKVRFNLSLFERLGFAVEAETEFILTYM